MPGYANRLLRSFKSNPWPLLLFVLGATVRLIYMGSIPPGLNQDEASVGYDAYAILHYGMDRNGVHLPVHLIAWGSGQNALYAYLSIPFLLLFGLNPLSVRALSVFMGLIGMLFFYLIMRRLYPSKAAGAFAMFIIAINPWHIMMSRWALESNLFPTVVLIAFYFLIRSCEDPKWSFGFTALLALSLYAYGTAYFFVPVFAVLAAVLLLYRRKLKLQMLLWNSVLFVLAALPILLFIVINRYGQAGIHTPFLSVPKLTVPRVEEVSSIFGGDMLKTAWNHFRVFTEMMYTGSDGLLWNTLPDYGYAYPLGLPVAAIGLFVMLAASRKRASGGEGQALVLLWLLAAVLMAFITDVNINRMNIIFFPLLLLIAAGCMWLWRRIRFAGILASSAFAVMFGMFANAYFRELPQEIGPAFYESAGEAISYASGHSSGEVYVTDEINMPYIYVLFYERIDPADFLDTVVYANPGGAFQQVSSFGRYRFGRLQTVPSGSAYVFGNNDPLPAVQGEYSIKQFARYSVLLSGEDSGASGGSVSAEPGGFVNGGFEEGTSGWSFTAGTGVAANNPYSGTGLAYLDPGGDKRVAQVFTPAASGEYRISVIASAAAAGGKLGIRAGGVTLAEMELAAGETYHPNDLPAVALKEGEQAEIYITGGNGWINIDEVRLEQ
ncbi:glycosyltransferase family 39 protein [Paenibacillus tengchongensis]|uniref:glycosyltransferase family 39 protein n=1 Tax=Paenibacillus tengchongensis TaxID=2608684 RepID=UPI00124D89D7|nr:glycosyltransferase family 39 protein [Paenibacillus tengchongensis]